MINKSYLPNKIENKWYKKWELNNCFENNNINFKEYYSILMPPPNITGILTVGHVLNITLQDILIQFARQKNKKVIWIPGTDHAGIATQIKIENFFEKENKKFSKKEFFKKKEEWKEYYNSAIIESIKKLGASCSWSKFIHTMDKDYSNSVLHAFVMLYNEGYIYKGKKIVNWCTKSKTAVSDEEVILKKQKSKLYNIKYKLEVPENNFSFIEVSTTRPETCFGDVALAIHPNDYRYNHLIGKKVYKIFSKKEKIPIIADKDVDSKFGTGILKITPAHDSLDFIIGERHNLKCIKVINLDGTMNYITDKYIYGLKGLDRFKAREIVVENLQKYNLVTYNNDYINNIKLSDRSNSIIEPMISTQWFLKYPKIEEAKKVVNLGIIKFWPKHWEKVYLHWLNNIQDWCISRQIFLGHRIPVWYKKNSDKKNYKNWHVSVDGPKDKKNWVQETNVLDTWASSWLWALGSFGWPNKNKMNENNFNDYYPTNILITGPDIIFFWVARMIIASLKFLDNNNINSFEKIIPFKNVYFTNIIRDKNGKKMSKSLGNSPDIQELINEYGADALRFGIVLMVSESKDIIFSIEKIKRGQKFCNKIWNILRLRTKLSAVNDKVDIEYIIYSINYSNLIDDDIFILQELINLLHKLEELINIYDFNNLLKLINNFFWNEFCDWYVEIIKNYNDRNTTQIYVFDLVLRQILIILHPFIPFITEEIWEKLKYNKKDNFIKNTYLENPSLIKNLLLKNNIYINENILIKIKNIRNFIVILRGLTSKFNLSNEKRISIFYKQDFEKFFNTLSNIHLKIIYNSTYIKEFKLLDEKFYINKEFDVITTNFGNLYVIDHFNKDLDKNKIIKEIILIEKNITKLKSNINNNSFIKKAPTNVIINLKEKLENLYKKLENLTILLKNK